MRARKAFRSRLIPTSTCIHIQAPFSSANTGKSSFRVSATHCTLDVLCAQRGLMACVFSAQRAETRHGAVFWLAKCDSFGPVQARLSAVWTSTWSQNRSTSTRTPRLQARLNAFLCSCPSRKFRRKDKQLSTMIETPHAHGHTKGMFKSRHTPNGAGTRIPKACFKNDSK